ncbi:MAG: hypothetical protein GY882_08585 [Actinomycetia bacterium]|nr:hypothetical protein [Actinomycetes bacterium]
MFPAIFMTTMVGLWLSQGPDVPLGAAGPMLLGSTSVAVYATTTSEQVFLGTASVGGYLDGGRRSATILVPFDPDLATGSYRVVADDDGTGGSITECDEVNNGVDWP